MQILQRNVANQRVWLSAFVEATGVSANDEEANITAVIALDDGADAALDDNGANPTPGGDTTRPGEYYYVLSAAESNANVKVNVKAVCATAGITVITHGGSVIPVFSPSFFSTDYSGLSVFDHTADTVIIPAVTETQIDTIETRVVTALPNSGPGVPGGVALFDNVLPVIATGTVASVTNGGQFILSAGASANNTQYEGAFLGFGNGPASPQFRFINIGQYDGTSKEVLFPGTGSFAHRPFNPAPEAGNTWFIFGLGGLIPSS